MAGSRVQVNKAHKTRFASKSSRNIHKTSLQDKSKISKTDRNVAKGARNARIQRNKMVIFSCFSYLFICPFIDGKKKSFFHPDEYYVCLSLYVHNLSRHFDYLQPTKLKIFVINKGGRFRKKK